MLKRKWVAALMLAFFTVLVFTLWDLYGILSDHQSFSAEFASVTGKTFLLLLPDAWTVTFFAYPVIILYGITVSVFSDWVAEKRKKGRFWTSLVLHFFFGLVSAPFSLGYGVVAALIGFGLDRALCNKNLKKAAIVSWVLTVLVLINAIGSLLVKKFSGLEY